MSTKFGERCSKKSDVSLKMSISNQKIFFVREDL